MINLKTAEAVRGNWPPSFPLFSRSFSQCFAVARHQEWGGNLSLFPTSVGNGLTPGNYHSVHLNALSSWQWISAIEKNTWLYIYFFFTYLCIFGTRKRKIFDFFFLLNPTLVAENTELDVNFLPTLLQWFFCFFLPYCLWCQVRMCFLKDAILSVVPLHWLLYVVPSCWPPVHLSSTHDTTCRYCVGVLCTSNELVREKQPFRSIFKDIYRRVWQY